MVTPVTWHFGDTGGGLEVMEISSGEKRFNCLFLGELCELYSVSNMPADLRCIQNGTWTLVYTHILKLL